MISEQWFRAVYHQLLQREAAADFHRTHAQGRTGRIRQRGKNL